MVDQAPVTAAGAREPTKRPKPIPVKVKDAIRLMVLGRLDDSDCQPLDFIAAARECGIKPDVMRRYLDRPQVRALLMAERRAFRAAICASNEAALLDIRNNAVNAMARIGAIRQLEQMDEADTSARPGAMRQQLPGMTVVLNVGVVPPQPLTVEHDPLVPRSLSPVALDVRPTQPRRPIGG
jgi:hypothetical protein